MITIFTIIDCFSKTCQLIPLRKLPTAFQTAQLLIKHVFRLHGIPQEILNDRGPQITSQVWKHFCSALEAKVTLTSGYHPQSNGQTERMSQELKSTLWCFSSINPSDWSQFLPWVEYAHNTHISAATGLSPFEISLGYQPPLFPSDEREIAVTSVQHHIHRCRNIWNRTISALNWTELLNRTNTMLIGREHLLHNTLLDKRFCFLLEIPLWNPCQRNFLPGSLALMK